MTTKLHPVLQELCLSPGFVESTGGTKSEDKPNGPSDVSTVEVLSYLLENDIVTRGVLQSAIQAIRERRQSNDTNPPVPSDQVKIPKRKQTDAKNNEPSKGSESFDTNHIPSKPAGANESSNTVSNSTSGPVGASNEYRTRHIALRFLYDGANFTGLAQNLGQESDNSVEKALFQALLRARLIESRETCGYSRCGRTDKGVSAAGQVVALHLKSAIPIDASLDPEGQQIIGPQSNDNDDDQTQQQNDEQLCCLPKNEYETISAWVVPRKRGKKNATATNDQENLPETSPLRVQKELSEYSYAKILNNLLPPEIRIIGWAPVSKEFSARFSANLRTYRYFFLQRQMDLDLIRSTLTLLVGKHDFRNFCKMDVEKVYNFERVIHSIALVVIGQNDNSDISSTRTCYVQIDGQAFLWHQIRCIMQVLFMIGNRLEPPSVITELLNVDKYPGKPAYPLAPERPLVLHSCGYPNLQVGYSVPNIWAVSCQLEQQWEELVLAAARIRNAIQSFRDVTVRKDELLQFATSKVTERIKKLKKAGTLKENDEEDKVRGEQLVKFGTPTTISWGVALMWLAGHDLVPDSNGLTMSVHIPILKRSMGTTYEEKVQALKQSDKRRQKFEENVIKKRKTADEDAAFYASKLKQGGTGM